MNNSETAIAQAKNIPTNVGAADGTFPAILDAVALAELGVTLDDRPLIREMADRLSAGDRNSIAEFGRDVAEHTARYADELLDHVKNKDLDSAGAKLSQVVTIAKALNVNALSDRRSTIPLIGPWIDKMKLSAGAFMGQFESTKAQIDTLVSEIQETQTGLVKRNATLEQMFSAVGSEYRTLGLHIAAGKLRLAEFQAEASALRAQALTPSDIQSLSDLDSTISNLDIRIGNLTAMQQSALQTLPQIRVLQSNNGVLVDKFHTIREITVPAWKRQFMLALGLNEQRNAVQLANTIDDATNDLLKRNAELLHRNSVETAKANQRLVIDVSTLQEVQATLIKTVEEVIEIHAKGAVSRREAETRIESMHSTLRAKFTRVADQRDQRPRKVPA